MAVIRSPFSRVPRPVDTSGAAEYYRKVLGRDISDILPSGVSAPVDDEVVQPADMPVAPLRVPEPFDYSRLGSGATVSPTSGRMGGVDSSGVPSELQRPLASAVRTVGRSAVEPEDTGGIIDRLKNIASGVNPASTIQRLLPDFIADPIERAKGAVGGIIAEGIEVPKQIMQAGFEEIGKSREASPVSLPFGIPNPFTYDYKSWFNNVMDEDYNIDIAPLSKALGKENIGTQLVDKPLDFIVGEILLDPLTGTTLGAGKFAGTAGRSALGSEISTNTNLIAQFGDDAVQSAAATVQRYGEHALPDAMRRNLINQGVMDEAGFRLYGQVLPGTARAAGAVGLGVGRFRAGVGDIAQRLPGTGRFFTAASRRGLSEIARGSNLSTQEIASAFAKYRSSISSKANAAQWSAETASGLRNLARELDENPNSAQILDYAEGFIDDAAMPDADALRLGQELRSQYDRILDDANRFRTNLIAEHGGDVGVINRITDYAHHTLTDEAKDFMRSRKGYTGRFKSIRDEMGIDLDDTANFMRARVLGKGKVWLGEPLQRGGINEINERSLAELGFKWFEDRPGTALLKYVEGMATEIRRTMFIDDLFRLAPDQIAPVAKRLITEENFAERAARAGQQMTKLLAKANREIVGNKSSVYAESEKSLQSILEATIKVADPQFADSAEARQIVERLLPEVLSQKRALDSMRTFAEATSEGLRRQYEDIIRPLQQRLDLYASAVDQADAGRVLAKDWLLARHAELLPDVISRPSQPQQLANQIIRELNTRLSGAARQSAVRKAEETVARTRQDLILDMPGFQTALPEARRVAKALPGKIRAARNKLQRALANDPVLREYADYEEKFLRLATEFDSATAVAGEREVWASTVGQMFDDNINSIRQLLDYMPQGVRVPKIAAKGSGSFKQYDEFIEMVPVRLLAAMRGNALNYDVADLAQDISDNGIKDPLILIYSTEDKFVRLGEGNHRLQAAIDAGFTHLPARVSRKVGKKWLGGPGEYSGIQVRGWTSPERIPSDIKPSEIMDFAPVPSSAVAPESPTVDAVAAWVRKADRTLAQLDMIDMSAKEKDLWERLLKQILDGEARIAKLENESIRELSEMAFTTPKVTAVMREMKDNWQELSGRFQDIQVSPELKAQLKEWEEGIRRMDTPEQLAELSRAYNKYYRWFKSTAILTPGFTVRNAITAAFNNTVAGVDPKAMTDGIKFARALRERGGIWGTKGRKEISTRGGASTVMKRLGLDPQEAEIYDNAFKSVLASGGGQAIDDVVPRVGQATRVFDNKFRQFLSDRGYGFRPFRGGLSDASRRLNGTVEMAARMGMALDGARKGYSVMENAARISRYHFDYTDLSRADEMTRRVIPFWLFMSRNLPLQLTNMVARPGAYNAWGNLRESTEQFDDPLMADWRRQRGGISTPWGAVFDFDLPFQDVQGQLGAFTPRSLFGSATPILRSPVELMTGNRVAFGTSYPYSDDYRGAGLSDIPAAFAGWIGSAFGMEGGTTTGAEGIMVSEKFAGPLVGLAPPLQQLQRIGAAAQIPQDLLGGQESYYERDPLSTLLSYGGLGYTKITPEERERTVRSRRYELQEELNKLRQRGKLRE